MEWVETTGRTVEEAQDAALDELGVDELDAEFEVLEEPKLGLFGRVRAEARVRARVRPNRPPAKDERRGRRRRAGSEAAAPPAQPAPAAMASPPASRTAERASADRQKAAHKPSRDRQGGQVDNDVPMTEQAEAAREFLAGLVGAIGGEASVEIHEIDEQTVEVAVVGDALGLLIGPSGATLAAVQDLTRTAVQRRTGGRNGRIMVDVGGYREKRRAALERFARQVATQVMETGQRKVLEPMQAADRKVVHDTVNTIEGVATTSEGEEPRRRVVIQPA